MTPERRRTVLASALVGLGAATAVGAAIVARRQSAAPLSPAPALTTSIDELARKHPKLEKLSRDPKLGSLLKEFAVAYTVGGLPRAKELARTRGLLNSGDELIFTILTESDEPKELEAEIERRGGRVTGRDDHQLNVAVPWSKIEEEVAAGKSPDELLTGFTQLDEVRGIVPTERPQAYRTGSTEGVKKTRAADWQKAGFRGAGVKVGVLDPVVSQASRFVGTALPANTSLWMKGCVGAGGRSLDGDGLHGVAAAEIIHEMAPDAQLFIACGAEDWDAAVNWLVGQGVRVISHSAGTLTGPRNGKGRQQQRIDQLAKQGILWVNSAGNEALRFHRGKLTGKAGWHEFAPGKTAMRFTQEDDPDLKITFTWGEWGASRVSNYDLYLFDARMNELARSENNNLVFRQPQEVLTTRVQAGGTYYVGLMAKAGAAPATFILDVRGAAKIDYPTPVGSLSSPSDAVGAVAVGAVDWSTDKLASYSSLGPTEDGRAKPEISAPSSVSSLVFKGTFSGTSAAAPHVAGAAALLWGRFPQYTRSEIVSVLLSRAKDLGPAGHDTMFGAGRLDLGDPATVAEPKPAVVTVPPAAPPVPGAPPPTPVPGAPAPTPVDDGPSFEIPWRKIGAVVGVGAVGAVAAVVGFVWIVASALTGGKRRAAARHAAPPPAAR
ncbi:MAG: S8 family serine peptidase, partial [Polyangiaceae bacterium]|nr:S8 family serine peptidase [Polyangiaceae bacterium]